MKKLFLVISILALLCGAAFASGPAVQLTATGSTVGDCTGGAVPILTPTQFNANTGGYIVPGATITMCGTFTGSTTTLLTTPAAGTAGSPIRLLFDSGGSPGLITYPAIPVAGAIVVNQPYWIIDGNLLSGTITSTTNGDCVGCLTTTQSVGINVSAANVEIKNLNIGPIFQRSATDTSSNGNATAGIEFNQGDNIKADGNIVTNAFIPIYVIYQTLTSAAVYNNITDYSSHHIVFGDNNASASGTGILIYGNTLGPHFNIWQDTGSQTMHADGIFVFAGNAGSTVTAMIYNNTITGDMCTSAGLNCTAYIYLDGNNNSWVFNNRVQHLSNTGTGPEGGIIQRATANNYSGNHIVNNTYIGGPNAIQFKIGTTAHTGTGLIAENNIWSTGQYLYGFGANNFNELGTSDNNVFYAAGSDVAVKGVDSSPTFYASLGNWQAISSQDSHSVSGNPLLTSFVPQTGSSAILQGVNLYSSCSAQPNPGLGALCFDALGNARNSSTKWTAGAVEYQGGGGTVVAPVCTPGAGGYSASQTITCTDATPSATICLVLTAGTSGIPPTAPTPGTCGAGSTTYTVPFAISSTSVLEALGTLVGSTNSSVMTAPYTITPPGGGGATFSVGQIEVHGTTEVN